MQNREVKVESDEDCGNLTIGISMDTDDLSKVLKKVRRAIDAAVAILDAPETDGE